MGLASRMMPRFGLVIWLPFPMPWHGSRFPGTAVGSGALGLGESQHEECGAIAGPSMMTSGSLEPTGDEF